MAEVEVCWQGIKVKARFTPKNTATLRPVMLKLIGQVFEFEWAGFGQADEPYPGQTRWMIARDHKPALPNECKGLWCPLEDLEILQ